MGGGFAAVEANRERGGGVMRCFAIFGAGFMAAINVVHLLPNPCYDAQWWKAGVCLLLGFCASLSLIIEKGGN